MTDFHELHDGVAILEEVFLAHSLLGKVPMLRPLQLLVTAAILFAIGFVAATANAQWLLSQVSRDGNHRRENESGRTEYQYKDGQWSTWRDWPRSETGSWNAFVESPIDFTYSKLDMESKIELARSWLLSSQVPGWGAVPNQTPEDDWRSSQRLLYGARFYRELSALDQSYIAEIALTSFLSAISGHLDITGDRAFDVFMRLLEIILRNPYNDFDVAICDAAKRLQPEQSGVSMLSPVVRVLRDFMAIVLARSNYDSRLSKLASVECEHFDPIGNMRTRSVSSYVEAALKLNFEKMSEDELANEGDTKSDTKKSLSQSELLESLRGRGNRCPQPIVEKHLRLAIAVLEEYPTQKIVSRIKVQGAESGGQDGVKCLVEFDITRVVTANRETPKPVYWLQRRGELNRPVGAPIYFSTAKEGASKFYGSH